jgi:transposase-like protein
MIDWAMAHDPHDLAELITELRLARFAGGLECPRCSSRAIQGWGSFSGRKRYMCTACGRTFSDLTGTPASYLKRVGLLRRYAASLSRCLSVRAAAAATGIHPSTAFRWRHRLIESLRTHRRETLSGEIELVTRRYPESRKGDRHLPRAARHRGPEPAKSQPAFISVVIAVDRKLHVVTAMAADRMVRTRDLEQSIRPNVSGNPVLVAPEGRFGPVSVLARRMGGSFRDARGRRNRHGFDRIAGARQYSAQLAAWMERFRGVATRYLGNYLAWHRALSYADRQGFGGAVLRWPILPWSHPTIPANRAHSAAIGDNALGGAGRSVARAWGGQRPASSLDGP